MFFTFISLYFFFSVCLICANCREQTSHLQSEQYDDQWDWEEENQKSPMQRYPLPVQIEKNNKKYLLFVGGYDDPVFLSFYDIENECFDDAVIRANYSTPTI